MNLNCAGRQMVERIRVRQHLNAAKTIERRGETVLTTVLLKAKFTMAPWDISSAGIHIPIFSGTGRVTNNYMEQIICVRHFATQFVEKIISVEQLNEFIDGDDFRKLDPAKLM